MNDILYLVTRLMEIMTFFLIGYWYARHQAKKERLRKAEEERIEKEFQEIMGRITKVDLKGQSITLKLKNHWIINGKPVEQDDG